MRYGNLAVEPDAETVEHCLDGGALKLVEIDNVILDCMKLMSSMINVRLCFICRAKSVASHSLVGIAKSIGSKSWLGNVPEPTASIVWSDALSIYNK